MLCLLVCSFKLIQSASHSDICMYNEYHAVQSLRGSPLRSDTMRSGLKSLHTVSSALCCNGACVSCTCVPGLQGTIIADRHKVANQNTAGLVRGRGEEREGSERNGASEREEKEEGREGRGIKERLREGGKRERGREWRNMKGERKKRKVER